MSHFYCCCVPLSEQVPNKHPVQAALPPLPGENNKDCEVHVYLSPSSALISAKEIKIASECIVELYKHAEIFKNTREVHREA